MKFTYDHSDEKEWEEYEEYIPELPRYRRYQLWICQRQKGNSGSRVTAKDGYSKEEETPYRESPYEDDLLPAGSGFGFGLGKSEIEETEDEEEKTVFLAPAEEEEEEEDCSPGTADPDYGETDPLCNWEEFVLNGSNEHCWKSKIRADIRIQNNPAIGNVHCKITREEECILSGR
ncbi:MAG: hypothetical protein ACLRH0_11910 [Blautia wexlerae]